MSHPTPRRAVALGALALALAGCSAGSATQTTSSSTTLGTTTTTAHYVPQYVIVGGHIRVLIPTEQDHAPINTATGVGQNVVITTRGFAPYTLYAMSKTPIVFTNLTDVTQIVRFHDFPNVAQSPPIRPGRSWSFSYNAVIVVVYSNRSDSELGQLHIGTCPPNCA
jgi:hypothetical protein